MSFSDPTLRIRVVRLILILGLLAPSGRLAAQMPASGATAFQPRALPGTPWLWAADARDDLEPPVLRQVGDVSPGRAFLSSALVPGLGQYQQGNRRWAVYLGVEILTAYLHFDRRATARRLRGRYRDLAWDVARGGGPAALRTDGDFVYYETLTKWTRSGAFDLDASLPGVSPETDPQSFNGSIWALAVEIFDLDPTNPMASPGYAGALDYYQERAYGSSFLWDWSASPASQERFAELIEDSDRGFRSARQALGLLLANHLVSALDGFITARVHAVSDSRFLIEASIPVGS